MAGVGVARMKPTPHNPDKLTKRQIGRAPWRLLDEGEIMCRARTKAIQCWISNEEKWADDVWAGCLKFSTYRTRLTRRQLARLK